MFLMLVVMSSGLVLVPPLSAPLLVLVLVALLAPKACIACSSAAGGLVKCDLEAMGLDPARPHGKTAAVGICGGKIKSTLVHATLEHRITQKCTHTCMAGFMHVHTVLHA
jgi:hypothetical protein